MKKAEKNCYKLPSILSYYKGSRKQKTKIS